MKRGWRAPRWKQPVAAGPFMPDAGPPERIVTEHARLPDSEAVQRRQDATVRALKLALKGMQ